MWRTPKCSLMGEAENFPSHGWSCSWKSIHLSCVHISEDWRSPQFSELLTRVLLFHSNESDDRFWWVPLPTATRCSTSKRFLAIISSVQRSLSKSNPKQPLLISSLLYSPLWLTFSVLPCVWNLRWFFNDQFETYQCGWCLVGSLLLL